MGEVEAVEDLEAAALEAVSLAVEDLGSDQLRLEILECGNYFCASFVDDSCFHVQSTHPFCCHQTRWSGADDEHIDFGSVGW